MIDHLGAIQMPLTDCCGGDSAKICIYTRTKKENLRIILRICTGEMEIWLEKLLAELIKQWF